MGWSIPHRVVAVFGWKTMLLSCFPALAEGAMTAKFVPMLYVAMSDDPRHGCGPHVAVLARIDPRLRSEDQILLNARFDDQDIPSPRGEGIDVARDATDVAAVDVLEERVAEPGLEGSPE